MEVTHQILKQFTYMNNLWRFTTLQLDLFLEQDEFIDIYHAMIFEHFSGSSSADFKSSSCDGSSCNGNDYPLSLPVLSEVVAN